MARTKGQFFWRRIVGGTVAGAVVLLSACQSVSQSQTTSLVRLVDASYNAPAVDIYAGNTEIARDVSAGTITRYAILAPGAVTITVDAAGTKNPLATLTVTLQASEQHSVYLTDAGNGLDVKLLKDRAESSPVGDFSVRFLQAAHATGAVDVYYLAAGEAVKDATPVVKGLQPGQDSSYVDVPDGTYSLVVTRAGSTEPIFMGSSLTYAGGEVRTVLIQDEPAVHGRPVQVLVGDDQN